MTARPQKNKRRNGKSKPMTASLGEEIIAGLTEAIAYEKGKLPNVRTKRIALTARTATAAPAPAW